MSYNPQNPNGQATSANSAPVVIASDQSAVSIRGQQADGAAVSGNPVRIAGTDGTNARSLLTDTSGRLAITGPSATGAAVPSNAFYIAGVNTSGNLTAPVINTSAADAQATSNNSLLVQNYPYVYNGTTYDRTRSASAVAGTTGTGLVSSGILGFDGTNYQRIKTNVAGDQYTLITDGTTVASTVAGDSGQNAQIIASGRKEVPFTTTTVQALAATDVSNYQWVSVHITSQGTSSNVAFQCSNDNTNWVSQTLYSSATTSTSGVTSTTSSSILYHGSLAARYFRVNVTGISAGTTAGVIQFFTAARALPSIGVSGSGLSGSVSIQSVKGSTTTNMPTLHTNFGVAVSGTAKASAGNIYAFSVSSVDTNLVYFQLINTASAPAGGATPLYSFPIPAGTATVPSIRSLDEGFFSLTGRNFTAGISWGFSTTAATYTAASTAANYTVHIHYA